jgi:hypothetical protein
MPQDPIVITTAEARRLALRSQLLEQPRRQPDVDRLLGTIRRLGCVQIDPINVVARNPLLVLWSRLGRFDPRLLDSVMWDERLLFEYWAHAASILLVEDYPIHQQRMVNFTRGNGEWSMRVRDWMDVNEPFRQYILNEIRRRGPLFAAELENRYVESPWSPTGWTSTTSVSTMLGMMWEQGDITVTRRAGAGFGLKKQWGLLEHHMPQWKEHQPIPSYQAVRLAAQRSLRALGVGTAKHIQNYFIRGGYPGLDIVLNDLLAAGAVRRVKIEDDGRIWPGDWFVHVDSLSDLAKIRQEGWPARTVLLSPFDNLIANRDRTETLFDFYYRIEIYTPEAKRQFGYYVMPILYGDRLIGRIDPRMDRKTKTLIVNAVHKEPNAPESAAVAVGIDDAVRRLGRFLGAERVQYGERLAAAWAGSLRDGPC